ncbi:ribose-phosphate pyrophosphokinase [Chloroflexus sp. MS-CIW-1]|jgi:ribose-phosphate pyrophosphokinase|uniref:ribose-phosphate diphosphokinase n=1 Tax=unclassified Chloroflexus TaxID=2633855 RepID=UPI0004DFB2D5|nr:MULTISPECIES: ribose-phosphate pyrophosphokinase [unclassified Chloroflexus]MBO9348512.1 ribose-phosphate pyrophosphokinase [Chloroflexus sp.]MDN5272247.1 ribose-phosphate pyrophosphokinase [Chloroflexus sp. MS-CIW-1]
MGSRFDEMRIFAGNGNLPLARAISERLGVPLGDITIVKFSNENIFVKLNESVREKDVFVIQSLSMPDLSDRIMELLIMLDACKRASAGRITAVIPYYAYGRTDKKDQPRVPITARLLADMIQVAGAHQVMTIDLHAGQIQGFFSIPMDELTAMNLLVRYFADKGWNDLIVVSPDVGFAKRARNFAEALNAPLAIAEKRRLQHFDRKDGSLTVPEILNLIGDVRGKRCLIVDDEIATGSSILEVVQLLEKEGASEIYACCVHAVFAGNAIERLRASSLREVVVTDTLPILPERRWPGLTILSVSTLIAEVIQRIHSGVSVDTIFQHRRHPALS